MPIGGHVDVVWTGEDYNEGKMISDLHYLGVSVAQVITGGSDRLEHTGVVLLKNLTGTYNSVRCRHTENKGPFNLCTQLLFGGTPSGRASPFPAIRSLLKIPSGL